MQEIVFFRGHPSWRSALDFHAKGFAVAVIAGALAGAVTAIASGHVMAEWIIVVVLVILAGVLLAGLISRTRTTYMITSERLTIHRGLLSRDTRQTRLDRVQNVNARQSMLERIRLHLSGDFQPSGNHAHGGPCAQSPVSPRQRPLGFDGSGPQAGGRAKLAGLVRPLPREIVVLAAEVTIGRGLLEDRAVKAQVLTERAGAQVEV